MKRDGQVWAFVQTGGPCERMGPTFFGRVDVGILDSPMGPLGLPGLISQFILFRGVGGGVQLFYPTVNLLKLSFFFFSSPLKRFLLF